MPEVVDVDKTLLDKWNTLMDLRDDKPCRTSNEKVIGKSLEAKVIIGNNESFKATEFLQEFNDLQQLFIVSQVEVVDTVENGTSYKYGDIRIEHAEGENVKDVGTIAKN